MFYTTDGSTPSVSGAHGTTYTGPISVSSSETIKIVGGGSPYLDGPVASYQYSLIVTTFPSFNGGVSISGGVKIQ
jgi:hypothetical protein